MILKSDSAERTIFACSGHGGHCCDDWVELYSDRFFDDCGEDYEFWFHVRSPQDSSLGGLWYALKYWWRNRHMTFMDISMNRTDLEALRDAIDKELSRSNPVKSWPVAENKEER